jgi:hypothetical protein
MELAAHGVKGVGTCVCVCVCVCVQEAYVLGIPEEYRMTTNKKSAASTATQRKAIPVSFPLPSSPTIH